MDEWRHRLAFVIFSVTDECDNIEKSVFERRTMRVLCLDLGPVLWVGLCVSGRLGKSIWSQMHLLKWSPVAWEFLKTGSSPQNRAKSHWMPTPSDLLCHRIYPPIPRIRTLSFFGHFLTLEALLALLWIHFWRNHTPVDHFFDNDAFLDTSMVNW